MTISTFAPDFDYNDASKTLGVDKVDVLSASFEAADGTAPFTVTSTTKITNLNADKIDGLDSTAFLKVSNNLSDITNAGTARTNLVLGNVDNTSDASKPVSTAAQAALDLKAPLASPTFTGTVTVPAPVNASDASTKGYADAIKQGLDIKDSVKVASTVNIPVLTGLVNLSVIDGVTVSTGDRVLLKNQTAPAENGIWVVVASGAASRSTDANDSAKVTSGLYTFVSEGAAGAGTGFVLTTADPITLGTTPLVFTAFSGAGHVIAGNGLSESGNTLSINTGVTVDISTAQTLTNKSISGSQITSAVANATLAATATALQTARTIGGTSFDGTANISISKVEASAGTELLPSITASGDLDTGAWFPAANVLAVSTNGTERARINSLGKFLLGLKTSRTSVGPTGIEPTLQVESSGTVSGGSQTLTVNINSALGPEFYFIKTRGIVTNSQDLVELNDSLGTINFSGTDGVRELRPAVIAAAVDGVPGLNDMPGRLMFFTIADGASTPIERMRITSAGNVGIGTTPNASAILDVASTTKAFMPPRMTTTQKNAIASPTAGMVIYDSTLNKLCVYTTAWQTITSV